MDVFVIENDDYPESQVIWGVAASVEAAAKFMRETYGEPYIVEWAEPVEVDGGDWRMTGVFKAVPGYCGDGEKSYIFTRFQLVGL